MQALQAEGKAPIWHHEGAQYTQPGALGRGKWKTDGFTGNARLWGFGGFCFSFFNFPLCVQGSDMMAAEGNQEENAPESDEENAGFGGVLTERRHSANGDIVKVGSVRTWV